MTFGPLYAGSIVFRLFTKLVLVCISSSIYLELSFDAIFGGEFKIFE